MGKRKHMGNNAIRFLTAIAAAFALFGAIRFGTSLRSRHGPGEKGESGHSTQGTNEKMSRFHFSDVGASAGIEFTHFNSGRASLIAEDVGSGAAWGDYDGDGHEDLYISNWAGPVLMSPDELKKRPGNQLYRNKGDGTFKDVTDEAGVGHVGWDMACLWADVDNDGRLDLLVTGFTGVVLYRNKGDGTFDDVTKRSGLSELGGFCSGAAFGDFDGDGHLDLYVCRYVEFDLEKARTRPIVGGRPAVMTTPQSFPPQPNSLLKNNGDGTFTDVTDSSGAEDKNGRSLQAVFCDFNNDSLPDIYVANDQSPDALFINSGGGTFKDMSLQLNTWDPRAGMGVAVGDYDFDGAFDLFITHWVGEDSAFYHNQLTRIEGKQKQDRFVFIDVAPRVGVARRDPGTVGWAAGFFDFDNDGYLDIFQVNGSTQEDELTLDVLKDPKLMPQRNFVYWNNREGKFIDVAEGAGDVFAVERLGRGAAFADYDSDGLVDVFIVNHGAEPLLLRNTTPSPGNWLKVKLEGTESNRFGIGARVRLTTGSQTQTREILDGGSYLSCNSLSAHFGLGNAEEADSIHVTWPSGATSELEKISANQTISIRENIEELKRAP